MKFVSAIGGLDILEFGYTEICPSPWGGSECNLYCKDNEGQHYVFWGGISSAGVGFGIYPYDPGQGAPDIRNKDWCSKFCKAHRHEYQPIVLDKTDYNGISSLLGYGTYAAIRCHVCGKETHDWFFYKWFTCADCIGELKNTPAWKYRKDIAVHSEESL